MLKSLPFLFIWLPLIATLVAWFFGAANLKGIVIAAVVYTLALMFTLAWGLYTERPGFIILAIILSVVSLGLVPALGALVSVWMKPPPGPAPVEITSEAYDQLSPEAKEFLKNSASSLFKAGVRQYAQHLRTKGKGEIAKGLEGMVR